MATSTSDNFTGGSVIPRQEGHFVQKADNQNNDDPVDDKDDDYEGNTKEVKNSIQPEREEDEEPGGDVLYLTADIIVRREATHHSYHDSDSDQPDFGLGIGSSSLGVDLDKSDADSWDWTFRDENVSDLDIKAALKPTKAAQFMTDVSEDPVSETTDASLDLEHSEQQIDTSMHVERVHEAHEDIEKVKHETNYESSLLKKGKKEQSKIPQKNKYKETTANFLFQLKDGREGDIVTKHMLPISDKDDVVYFEYSLSSEVIKNRLMYLQDNCSIVKKTSGKSIQIYEECKSNRKKKLEVSPVEWPKLVKDFQNRNLRNKNTILDDAEAKFMFPSLQDYNHDSKMLRLPMSKRIVSPPTSLSFSKSEQPLPSITDKRVQSFSGKRHSLNDVLSEKITSLRLMHKGRAMSRPDLIVKSQMKAAVEKVKVNQPNLRRHKKWTGLELFRHFTRLVLILLKAIGLRRGKPEENNYNFLSWTVVYDEVLGISRLNYDSGALTFDPLLYKANKESTLSQETKDILRLPSDQRTEAHIHAVMVSFQNVIPSFSEFPRGIQQSMIKVCSYEKFEAGRVIIRQGHRAENFYFIISGCAVVTQMDSGADHVHTTNVLGKGNSFGELAFLHMSKRSATVTCREDVELICIERDDFIDIFMRPHQGEEPSHITFLKSIDLLKGWPIMLLPHANPKICAFTYVRRGVILCQDSARNDWIFVVYSGSCKVLKALKDGPITRKVERTASPEYRKVTLAPTSSSYSRVYTTSISNRCNEGKERQKIRVREQGLVAPVLSSVQNLKDSVTYTESQDVSHSQMEHLSLSQFEHLAEINGIFYKRHVLPTILPQNQSEEDKSDVHFLKKVSYHGSQPSPTNSIFRPKRQSYGFQPPALPQLVAASSDTSHKQQPSLTKTTFIEITRLEPRDIFGLEHVVLSGIRDVASCSLVSEGAEVVLISKTFFRKHLTEDTMKRMRQVIRPLPSEKALLKKYEAKKLWEAYKCQTLARHTQGNRRSCSKLQPF